MNKHCANDVKWLVERVVTDRPAEKRRREAVTAAQSTAAGWRCSRELLEGFQNRGFEHTHTLTHACTHEEKYKPTQ